MTAQEFNADVVFQYSGSIDLTGLSAGTPVNVRGSVYAVNSYVEFAPSASVPGATFVSDTLSSPPNIGTGSFKLTSSHSGSYFSVLINGIRLPADYTSGRPISGEMTFAASTFAQLGVNAAGGPYVWTLSNGQKVTLSFLSKVDNSAKIKTLEKKVKKLKKQIQKAKKNQKAALLKKLKKQLKVANSQINKLK